MITVGRRVTKTYTGPWHLIERSDMGDPLFPGRPVCGTVMGRIVQYEYPLVREFDGERCKKCASMIARLALRWSGATSLRVEVPMEAVISNCEPLGGA